MNRTPSWRIVGFVIGFTVLLLLIFMVSVTVPALNWLMFGLLGPAVLVVAARRPYRNVFNLIKGVSVVSACLCIAAALRWGSAGGRWCQLIVLIFGLNILEAVISDGARRRLGNAAVGALLLATMPGAGQIHPEPGWLRYDIGWLWLLAYTTWNLSFVAGRSPLTFRAHVAVLLAPLLANLAMPGVWAHARATTLAAHQLLCFASPALWHAMTVLGWDEEIRRAAPWLTAAALVLVLLVVGGRAIL